jgi:hypothetical protein
MEETILYGVLIYDVGLTRIYFDFDRAKEHGDLIKSTTGKDSLIIPARFSSDTEMVRVHKTPKEVWATIGKDGGSIILSVKGDNIPTEPVKLLDYKYDEIIVYKEVLGSGQLLERRNDETTSFYASKSIDEGYFSKAFNDWLEVSGLKKQL